jgi:8-oxo-dGTP pyrophosphatase MutT (NUDIX family)
MSSPILGADALIIRDGHILLGHRMDQDLWVFPGGAVDPGEAPWQAAVREAAEEVGVAATIVRLVGVAWQPATCGLVFDFLCTATGEPRPCLTETDDIGWFPVDAPPPNLFAPQAERLAGYLDTGWATTPALTAQLHPTGGEPTDGHRTATAPTDS